MTTQNSAHAERKTPSGQGEGCITSCPHSTAETTIKTGSECGIIDNFRPLDPSKFCFEGTNQSPTVHRGITSYSPGRRAVIAAKNDAAVAAWLDYRALLQCGAVEGNPHGIDIPLVLDALKNDWTMGPRSRKALWDELDPVERDRIKAAKGLGVGQ